MRLGCLGVVTMLGLLAGCGAQSPRPTTSGRPIARVSQPSTRPTQPIDNPVLDRAEALLQAHHWQAAHDLIVPWLRNHPSAADRDRGLFLLAKVYYQSGDRIRAFYHLDELLDNFPDSRLFFPALQLQYDIADAYLNGYMNDFLGTGLRIVPATDEAIEMLFRIQERSPGSPIAERALKRTADFYFSDSQFDLAGDAYSAFLHSYPRSPQVPFVKLRQAFSSLAQFRGPQFDATPLIDARAQFKEVQARYPELAAQMNVAQRIEQIDQDLAQKAYITADFYRRTDKPQAAAFLYRYVRQTYPNAPEAQLAQRELTRLPAWALNQPPPPASNPEAAATPVAPPNVSRPRPGETGRPQ